MELNMHFIKNRLIYPAILIGAAVFFMFEYKQIFVEQYMRYKLRDSYIVLSLSTTPHRINKISETINSLTAQKVRIKDIYLNVPYVFARENIAYNIPEYLLANKRLTILRGPDYGPATKLLGLLNSVSLPDNAIVITVDDDIIYPKNAILHLAYAALQQPNQAIGLSGADFYQAHEAQAKKMSSLGLKTRYNKNVDVTILQGYAGIAYRKRFFDASIFEINQFPQSCISSDDLYFSFYLAKHNIARHALANDYIQTRNIPTETVLATSADALHKQIPNPQDKHESCVAYLHEKFPEVKF